jgi:hypothetical protein
VRSAPDLGPGVHALTGVARLISALPLRLTQFVVRLNSRGIRLYDTMPVPEYPTVAIS